MPRRTKPAAAEPRSVARTVNPDAGDYPISAHPAEMAAAAAATQRSFTEFPYYTARYGERGWRFSLSDSGWITTLCWMTARRARSQIVWLGTLLASRGMPRFLLQRHLLNLHRELTGALPERADRYAILERCADCLRTAIETRLAGERFERLAADFEIEVRGCEGHIANMGLVLLGAAVDEAARIPKAKASVEVFACDALRFPPGWIEAVRTIWGRAAAEFA